MKILIVDNGSTYLERLKSLLITHETFIKKYSEIVKSDQIGFDLVVLSGGHDLSVVGHEGEFAKEIGLIKHATTPILGICLGFELIAYAYGAKTQKMFAKEKSILRIDKIISDPIFTNLEELSVFESHRWVITETGENLIPLAKSKDGIEIIKHKQKPIYGFQFHPEMFPYQTQGDELFANFMKIVENYHI